MGTRYDQINLNRSKVHDFCPKIFQKYTSFRVFFQLVESHVATRKILNLNDLTAYENQSHFHPKQLSGAPFFHCKKIRYAKFIDWKFPTETTGQSLGRRKTTFHDGKRVVKIGKRWRVPTGIPTIYNMYTPEDTPGVYI